jgi:hypothetical protein
MNIRLTFIALVAVTFIALVAGIFADSANALPSQDNEIVYFSDKNMSKEVGYFYLSCFGTKIQRGVKTRYWLKSQESCDDRKVPSIEPNCSIDGISATCTPEILQFLKR